jgi:hypothetical protein
MERMNQTWACTIYGNVTMKSPVQIHIAIKMFQKLKKKRISWHTWKQLATQHVHSTRRFLIQLIKFGIQTTTCCELFWVILTVAKVENHRVK